jgi:hypothetical protein
MNHMQTQIHKIHHDPNLGEATTFPLLVLSMPSHRACTQMSFCPKTPKLGILKFPKLGFTWFWMPITFCANLWLRWGMKQSCSPHRELFNNMWHTTCTYINQGDYWLLMVGSQIGTLIPGPSFGHNLCFKYPNGRCKTI